ncbi:hypothetical protein [Kosakonia radicincitans]|uniref:hypothetical protein n=1 Tax=Kosakonia radicincitans TaxID=283686 RepID=UPI001D093A26|nr:hypothetical protein [Kosakonia radicincitans]
MKKRFYIHVQPFQATHDQVLKFNEIMRNFGFIDYVTSDDVDYQLPPGGFIGNSTAGCQHIVDQTFSIANTAGFNANIFVCEFERSADLLPGYSLRR